MSTAVVVNFNLIHFGGNGGAKPFRTLTIVQLLTSVFQKLSFIRKKHLHGRTCYYCNVSIPLASYNCWLSHRYLQRDR